MRFLLLFVLAFTPIQNKAPKKNKAMLMQKNIAYPSLEKEKYNFVVIIPCYNFSSFLEKTLASVAEQTYQNYRVIFIDDCSTDGSFEKAQELAKQYKIFDRFTWVRNTTNCGILHNHYHAIHSCHPNEIVVCLDGDDALYDGDVLSTLNKIYNNKEVWMTYGSYKVFPCSVPCLALPFTFLKLKKMDFRLVDWCFTHLKTFYAGLFHLIKKQDLMRDDAFFKAAGDVALMYPMLEMSRMHVYFVDKLLYWYRYHPANEHNIHFPLQRSNHFYLRSLVRYKGIKSLPWRKNG